MQHFLPRVYKYILFLIVGCVLALSPLKTYAAQDATQTPTKSINSPTTAEQGLLVVDRLLFEGLSQLICQMRGVEPIRAGEGCLVIDKVTGRVSTANTEDQSKFRPGGLLAFTGNVIGMATFSPGHTANNVQNLANNFGIVKKAHAQEEGEGFDSLNQLQAIFTTSLNVVYLLLVIAFIIIGIGIMFRFNIDPRTVMTIQNQIPKIIIAIILITFSYSIAGALIDAMWVSTYVGVNALTQNVEPCSSDASNPEFTLTSTITRNIINNPMGFTNAMLSDAVWCTGSTTGGAEQFLPKDGIAGLAFALGGTIGTTLSETVVETIFGLDQTTLTCNLNPLDALPTGPGPEAGSFGACIQAAVYWFFRLIFGALMVLVTFVAILVSLFRLWYSLIKAFILVMLDIIIGPFWIFMGLIPGSTNGFTSWLRHLVAHLAVFPAAALLLTITVLLARSTDQSPSQAAFLPPLIGNPNIGVGINLIIAFGFILIIPELLNMVRDAIKTSGSKYGGTVSGGIGAAVGVPLGAAKGLGATEAASREYIMKKHGYDPRGRSAAILGRMFGRG